MENDNVFAVYDEWETEEGFKKYLSSDLYAVFRASMKLLTIRITAWFERFPK